MTKSLQELDRNFDEPKVEGDTTWRDARSLLVEGQGWPDESQPYTRMPDKAESIIREAVWYLSRASAGICIRFTTDATAISARYTLRYEALAMDHMPAVGVSGLDLYVRDGERWKWAGITRPKTFPHITANMLNGIEAKEREYALFLPLYNGIESLEIGINNEAAITAAVRPERKPIVFYGTSITQGGCASRAGMAYSCIIGRHLNYPTLNLGFSGNGRAEPEIATLLAELDPTIFVIDCIPNMPPDEVTPNITNLLDTLRAAHPQTPICLVENVHYQNEHLIVGNREHVDVKNRDLRAIFEARTGSDANLHYIPSADMWGDDTEATIDGVHATDVGFLRMAEKMEPVLRNLLS